MKTSKRKLARVEQLRVYVGDVLSGEGDWIDLPMDEDELNEFLARFPGDYEIQDYEAPSSFRMRSSLDIFKLNSFLLDAEQHSLPLEVAGYIYQNYGHINLNDINLHGPYDEGTDDDVAEAYAEDYLEQTGLLQQVPEQLQRFIDIAAYAEELRIDGAFVVIGQYVLEYPL